MSWGKAFKGYTPGTFVVGEKFVIYDREHTILHVQEGRGVAYVLSDGESNRPPQPRHRISIVRDPR